MESLTASPVMGLGDAYKQLKSTEWAKLSTFFLLFHEAFVDAHSGEIFTVTVFVAEAMVRPASYYLTRN